MRILVVLLLTSAVGQTVWSAESVTYSDLDRRSHNDHYVGSREPLAPLALIKLPVGTVKPRGWLRECLERQRDGMTGHLGEISAWLQKEDNAWFAKDGRGKWGWEEVPYWLKGYANLGYLLDDEAITSEAKVWLEAAIENQRSDGNFGPIQRFDDDGSQDMWTNMVMLFCLQSYYEYSNDPRVLDLMTRHFKYQATVPDDKLLTHYWQHLRGGDNLYSIFWLYNRTGDKFLLELAEKIHRRTANWRQQNTLPNWHNVNVAQSFGEPATWYLFSKSPDDLQFAYHNFHVIRQLYGQVPGGMFGSDENCRPGYDDPRQAIETCGMVEQMLSDETLLRITGDPFWADHCEEVAFNSLPAAFMPDFKSLRYLTSPNMVVSDRNNHAPGIQNVGPMLMMNPLSHRCCQHNHTHGWPYFCENLWLATPDNGLCAAMYSACVVEAKVGDGAKVKIEEETKYPFEPQVRFTVHTDGDVEFPLYLRVPGWCTKPAVAVNGKTAPLPTEAGKYIRIERTWRDGDVVTLELPMQVSLRTWRRNHNSVSVDFGPLTFALKIGEKYVRFNSRTTAQYDSKWRDDVDVKKWPAFEIQPTTPWNFGLVLDEKSPEESFTVVRKPWPKDDFPFTPESSPIEMHAEGKKILEWTLDRHGLCATLQDSPVRSDQPSETITLIPMGAARLRISAFPVIGEGPDAHTWVRRNGPPKRLFEATTSHCFQGDTVRAVADGLEPASSGDHEIPRHTFWPHKGTSEWIEAAFAKEREVSRVAVYWFDDTGAGECRVPKSWRLLYRDGDEWKPVSGAKEFGVAKDRFNGVAFDPIKTDALRIEVELQPEVSAGVLEWKVE